MRKSFAMAALFFCFHPAYAGFAPTVRPLAPERLIVLPGPAAKFDYMSADAPMHRILAAHRQAKTLEIMDLKADKPLQPIPVGEVQGIAIDAPAHRYFLGIKGGHSIVVVDSRSLLKTAEVKLEGPVDAIALDGKNHMLYAAQDDGDRLWVMDTQRLKLVGTVALPGEPEAFEYDPATDRIYLNIKTKDLVVRIDPATNRVDASWSSLPASSPHGLAIDGRRGRVYTAGHNGKLVAIDLRPGLGSGKVVSVADIAEGVDQIAYDAARKRIYSACKGFISVTAVTGSGLRPIANVPSPKGAHTLAVDPRTHDVWVCYADHEHSYLQKFRFRSPRFHSR